MQRHSSDQSEIKIPPNLLKTFNVYDLLEPQKNGPINSDATKVDKLIDIDDCSRDSGFQDSDLPSAFLDKNRDFDLIDVYQNILVTPQHIKKNKVDDNATVEVDAAFGVSNMDPGLKQFLDKLESGEKVDWLNLSQPQEETFTDHAYIDKKPRVLVPKVFTEPDSDPEDLIHEVLMQKTMEQLALGSINSSRKISEARERESPKKMNDKLNPVFKVAQPKQEPEVIPEFSRSSFINNVVKDSKLLTRGNERVSRPSEMELYQSQIDNSLTNFTVKAIQKDEKVYKKKRMVKPAYQTANYTKGPDFYEKSVVLPQIMARLNARVAYLDEKSNQKKRLILDAGVRPKAECNSAKLNAHVKKLNNQASSNTKVQVNKQPESRTMTKSDLTKNTSNKAGASGINSLNMKNVPIKEEARLCINKLTKNIRVHTTEKPCTNCGNPSTTKKVNTEGKYEAELSPVVLMEDCNKERLRALKRSQMFKDFVHNGKTSYEG